ncbi:uncharacterized protein LOC133843741 [Drosophila sulfurigaster albostrigata]|uniref:uncharacterized protein LOC133843741 n=1 Tax=Drosophila sulfurigaster albostrigata TaxID=89887 RepID=UPI002D21E6BE|nr:uncharacterized protein LOC133843741 [Drosophila sulfurigaster albostrigata]
MFVRVASVYCLALLATWPTFGMASLGLVAQPVDLYQEQLNQLLQYLMWGAQVERCVAIITDDLHSSIYDAAYFEAVARDARPYYMLRINASDELHRPSKHVQLVLQAIRSSGCDLHVITVLNGWQVKQLIGFVYESRALHMQHKFVLLHDTRLYTRDMWHVWSVFVRTVFVKRQHQRASFSLSTIDYPGILSDVLVLKDLGNWSPGKRIDGQLIFKDKTRDLRGISLSVAISEHVPMVQLNRSTNSYQGVEVEIIAALAKTLHFQANYYNLNESESNAAADWEGFENGNENASQLIAERIVAEVAQHNARFGIGDLHLFQSYGQHVELSRQHSVECLTFLTPESSTDNSWQTFILPFSGGMWAGVLLSLFVVGTIFYLISFLNALLLLDSRQAASFFRCLRHKQQRQEQLQQQQREWKRFSFRLELARHRQQQQQQQQQLRRGNGRDLFDDYANCILLTYSMLLYVALPRMPHHWPLRVLTGWYWIYCILLVATYRASFTAILANPAARVTIDTLQDLNRARIPPATGAAENREFFLESSDETVRELGASMEIVKNIDELTERIASGRCAYYDNEFYLRYLRVADEARGGRATTALHIMKECVVHMPVVLALEKNSALKPHVDDIIQHLSEAGLIAKWLRDAIKRLPAEEQAPQEALMNLNKFWSSFVALGIGYLISISAIALEHWHFRYVVMQHPLYDAYNPSIYYNFKRLYSNSI